MEGPLLFIYRDACYRGLLRFRASCRITFVSPLFCTIMCVPGPRSCKYFSNFNGKPFAVACEVPSTLIPASTQSMLIDRYSASCELRRAGKILWSRLLCWLSTVSKRRRWVGGGKEEEERGFLQYNRLLLLLAHTFACGRENDETSVSFWSDGS